MKKSFFWPEILSLYIQQSYRSRVSESQLHWMRERTGQNLLVVSYYCSFNILDLLKVKCCTWSQHWSNRSCNKNHQWRQPCTLIFDFVSFTLWAWSMASAFFTNTNSHLPFKRIITTWRKSDNWWDCTGHRDVDHNYDSALFNMSSHFWWNYLQIDLHFFQRSECSIYIFCLGLKHHFTDTPILPHIWRQYLYTLPKVKVWLPWCSKPGSEASISTLCSCLKHNPSQFSLVSLLNAYQWVI